MTRYTDETYLKCIEYLEQKLGFRCEIKEAQKHHYIFRFQEMSIHIGVASREKAKKNGLVGGNWYWTFIGANGEYIGKSKFLPFPGSGQFALDILAGMRNKLKTHA